MEEQNELEQLKKQVADLTKRLARLERLEQALRGEILGEVIGEAACECDVPDIEPEQIPDVQPETVSDIPGESVRQEASVAAEEPPRRSQEPDEYTIFEHQPDEDAFMEKLMESQEASQSQVQTQMAPAELKEELSGEVLDDPSDSGVITLDTLDAEKSLSQDLDDLGDEINRLFS